MELRWEAGGIEGGAGREVDAGGDSGDGGFGGGDKNGAGDAVAVELVRAGGLWRCRRVELWVWQIFVSGRYTWRGIS